MRPAFASETIINTIGDILLVLDPEGIIRLSNKASQLFFNQFEDDLRGKHITMIVDDPYFTDQFKGLLKSAPIQNLEITCNPKNYSGGRRRLLLSITPIKDRKEFPLSYVFLAKDITRLKKTEMALLKAKTDLNLKISR